MRELKPKTQAKKGRSAVLLGHAKFFPPFQFAPLIKSQSILHLDSISFAVKMPP
jgi:hypothetical protein